MDKENADLVEFNLISREIIPEEIPETNENNTEKVEIEKKL